MTEKNGNEKKKTEAPGFEKEAAPPALVEKAQTAAMSLPEAWDRKGDLIKQFGEEIELRWRVANMLAASGLSRHKKPEDIMAIQLTAFEMGVPLMTALRGMYSADGSIGIEGWLMDALAIERSGVTKRVHESNTRRCRMTLYRDGWDDLDVEYEIEDAIRAGLVREVKDDGTVVSGKRNWSKHPEEMLYWRALSKGLKRIAPDYFGGLYTLDELDEIAGGATKKSTSVATDELRALAEGRDLSEIESLSEDEMGRLREDLAAAVEAGEIDEARESEVLELVVAGDWAAARDAWHSIAGEPEVDEGDDDAVDAEPIEADAEDEVVEAEIVEDDEPEPEPEEAEAEEAEAEDGPPNEALASLLDYVRKTDPTAGTATDDQRHRLRQLALLLFDDGSSELEDVMAWVDHEDLGKRQAARIVMLGTTALEESSEAVDPDGQGTIL